MGEKVDSFTGDCLILVSDLDQRIEMHIRRDEDGTTTLYAFSGAHGELPTRDIQQGPFQSHDQAVGARQAIAAELLASGFRVLHHEPPIWQLPLQRQLNEARQLREAAKVNYRFDPKDVYLDW